MNTAEINPYSHDPPMMAIPRKDRKGVNRGASKPIPLLLQIERGDIISGSQEAK